MERKLQDGDVDKLNKILEYLCSGKNVSVDKHLKKRALDKIGINTEDYDRLKDICLEHNAAQRGNGYGALEKNSNTCSYINYYFADVYRNQKEDTDRQEQEDKKTRISIKNGQWALPISIISIIVAVASLLFSIFRNCN